MPCNVVPQVLSRCPHCQSWFTRRVAVTESATASTQPCSPVHHYAMNDLIISVLCVHRRRRCFMLYSSRNIHRLRYTRLNYRYINNKKRRTKLSASCPLSSFPFFLPSTRCSLEQLWRIVLIRCCLVNKNECREHNSRPFTVQFIQDVRSHSILLYFGTSCISVMTLFDVKRHCTSLTKAER